MKKIFFFITLAFMALVVLISLASPDNEKNIIYLGGPDYFWKISKNIDDKKRLYKVNIPANEKKLIYDTGEPIITDFRVAPSDTIIALLITERGITPPGEHEFSVLPKNSMVFIDMAGNEIIRLDEDVRKFSWSPDGESVAFIAGTYYEGGVGFKTTNVGIFVLKDGNITQIKKDFPHKTLRGVEGGGYEIRWAKHDDNIYIRDFGYLDGIYRYSIITGKSEKVEYLGIDFSPDGKYYKALEGDHIYLTETNEDVTSQLIARFGPEWSRVYLNWVFDKGHCLHIVNHSEEPVEAGEFDSGRKKWNYPQKYNVLYDIEKDRIDMEVTLPVSRWTGSYGELIFEKDGKFIVETYEDVFKK